MKTIVFLFTFAWLAAATPAQDMSAGNLPPGDSPTPTVFDRVNNAGDTADFEEADYIIVYDEMTNRINDKGVTFSDNYIIYKVITETGGAEKSVLNWHYEPLSSYVEVREVNIIRGDSAIPVSIENVIDLPAPQHAIYWSDRIKMLQLPRLQINDGIEVKIFRKGYSYALLDNNTSPEPDDNKYVPPMPGEYFDIVTFEATVPIVEKKYTLKIPSSKRLHSQVYNGPLYSHTGYIGDTTVYSWWNTDVPAWKPQPRRPDDTDILTKVVVATVESWEAKSRWFFDINEKQFEYTDAIKAKVDEILRKAGVANGTDEQKAFELVHWVAQNIRYSGQTMGPGEGYTLHSGAMIFEQRSGVCKDIAGMLITMMRAAGLDSYGAMTMAGSRIEDIPADQFNHCVVALRKSDGSFVMYDPTWVPFDNDIWSKFETEQHFLIGTPRGESLSRIPYSPPEESPLHITSLGTILPDGTYEGTFEITGNGAMDNYLRGLQAWYPLADLEHNLADKLAHIDEKAELLDFQRGDVLDFKKPMWWKIKYCIPEYAFIVDSVYEFKSPMMQLVRKSWFFFKAGSIDWPEERRDDVFLYNNQLLDGTETIKLPSGYKVNDPPKSDSLDETYAFFMATSDMAKKGLVINQKAEVRRRQIPPDGYAGFRKVIMGANDFYDTVFRAEKGGAR
nr:DUF3857 domain-containing transglutaminase family protein [candidate division Zixibacteria bacterium]